MNCYQFIEPERARWRNRPTGVRATEGLQRRLLLPRVRPLECEREDAKLAEQIRAVHEQSMGCYRAVQPPTRWIIRSYAQALQCPGQCSTGPVTGANGRMEGMAGGSSGIGKAVRPSGCHPGRPVWEVGGW